MSVAGLQRDESALTHSLAITVKALFMPGSRVTYAAGLLPVNAPERALHLSCRSAS